MRTIVGTTLCAGLIGLTTGCGDPVPSPHVWSVSALYSRYTTTVVNAGKSVLIDHQVLDGPLTTRSGRPVAGTRYRMDCSIPAAPNNGIGGFEPTVPPELCTAIVHSGTKFVIFAAEKPGMSGQFPSLAAGDYGYIIVDITTYGATQAPGGSGKQTPFQVHVVMLPQGPPQPCSSFLCRGA